MRSFLAPPHPLLLHHPFADHLVHRGFQRRPSRSSPHSGTVLLKGVAGILPDYAPPTLCRSLRADRLRDGNLPSGQRTISRWFETEVFANPGFRQRGNGSALSWLDREPNDSISRSSNTSPCERASNSSFAPSSSTFQTHRSSTTPAPRWERRPMVSLPAPGVSRHSSAHSARSSWL